ncbi:MAG: serine/threonine-protein kinase [Polyangiales bacterium]
MADRAMPQPGDVVAGKYRIETIIGEGGMGAVFAASHKVTGKRVALKWMLPALAADEGAVQRFMREAHAAGRIDHPNVVDIYDVGEHEGSIFLVMEYLTGEPLTKALNRGGLDARQVIQLLLPAMRGVAAAHAMGVVHRDLKPDNIFLCRGTDGSFREPKVLDFGISKVSTVGEAQLNPRLTRTGAVMGTPYYMSPEQIRGSSEVDQRTDVYAFGVILYEALTGQVPFDADAYSALILEIAMGTPKRPRELRKELPPGLEEVVMRAMAREPQQRYQSVEALARALEPFAEGATFSLDRVDPTGRASRLATGTTPFTSASTVALRGKRKPLVLAAVVVVLLLGGVVLALLRGSERNTAENVVQPAGAPATPHAAASAPPAPVHPEAVARAVADAGAAMERAGTKQVLPAEPQLRPEEGAAAAQPSHADSAHGHHHAEAEATPTAHPTRRPPGGRTGELNSSEF